MLQWLRDNMRSFAWTLWLVILAFVLGFAILPQLQDGDDFDDTHVARVGDLRVTRDEYQRIYAAMMENYRSLGPEMIRQLRVPVQALEQLVAQKVQVLEAKRLGLTVSNAELQQAILDIPGFTDEQGRFIGADRYATAVRRIGGFGSAAIFEDYLRNQILLEKLRSVVAAGLYIPDSAVEASYREEVEKAKIRFLELPAAQVAGEVIVEGGEVQTYYNDHKEDFRRPEQRVVTYLLVDNAKLRTSLEIPDAEIESYYRNNSAEFTQEEQVRARHILIKVGDEKSDALALAEAEAARRRLAAGADFATLAREVSEDPVSKDRGGDLGFFGRGRMIKEFEDAAFGAALNQVVGPVRSSFGYHVIETLEKRAGGLRSLDEVKSGIRFRLQNERAQAETETKAKELAARIAKEKLTTDEQWKALVAGSSYLSVEQSQPFGKQEPVPNVGRVPDFANAAFALKQGEISGAVKIPRGWAVLRLDDVRGSRVPELTEVEREVRQALTQKKQEQKVLARLGLAKSELAAGKSLDRLAKELGATVQESGEFGHGGAITGLGVNPQLTEAALALSAGQTGGPVATRNGGILFQVVERKTWDPAEFARNKAATRERLEMEELQRVLGALIEQRRRELTVSYSPQFLERMGIEGEPKAS